LPLLKQLRYSNPKPAVRKRGDAVMRATLNGVDPIVDLFPIIPHEAAVGVDCCGCMPRVKGDKIELVCNECGIVEGSIDGAILRAVVTSGIQHVAGGCSGDIVVNRFRGEQAELRCDKCGIVAGLVNPGSWADLVSADRS
jgi:hypothetical protein